MNTLSLDRCENEVWKVSFKGTQALEITEMCR